MSQFKYQAEIVRKEDNVGYGRRPVSSSYLEPGREQLLFLAERRAKLGSNVSTADVCEEPIFDDEVTGEIKGLQMSVGEGKQRVVQTFDLSLFQPLVEKIALDLVSGKQLDSSSNITTRVFAQEHNNAPSDGEILGKVTRQPMPLLEGNLEDFLGEATAVGPVNDDDHPVLILKSALEEAHEIIWQRNSERGAWLICNLYRQWRPRPEIFMVVHTAFEARGTTHERFSLDFSTETFTHAASQMKLRRRRLGRKEDVLGGFIHSHPFLPSILDGKEACPSCPLQPNCDLTSSFFSQKDAQFHAAMFGTSAAYAVEFVLGLTPREEFDLKMFCNVGGGFRERGYYRLESLPEVAAAAI